MGLWVYGFMGIGISFKSLVGFMGLWVYGFMGIGIKFQKFSRV